jgi:hypothetical protein
MGVIVSLYSSKKGEINNFLSKFYEKNLNINDSLKWEQTFANPIDSVNIIGTFIDNKENFDINMWVSLDTGFFINVTDFNSDKIIRYLYERYPY